MRSTVIVDYNTRRRVKRILDFFVAAKLASGQIRRPVVARCTHRKISLGERPNATLQ